MVPSGTQWYLVVLCTAAAHVGRCAPQAASGTAGSAAAAAGAAVLVHSVQLHRCVCVCFVVLVLSYNRGHPINALLLDYVQMSQRSNCSGLLSAY